MASSINNTSDARAESSYPSAGGNADATKPAMTEDEIALYDRQIRLWGMGAQEKIRSAHVLIITMRGLGNEIAKNLVLAGIGSLTIADQNVVITADLGSQFLLATPFSGEVVKADATLAEREAADSAAAASVLGKNRALVASEQLRALNPRVNINVETGSLKRKPPGFFEQFTLVIATDVSSYDLNYINTCTRFADRPLYAASSYGFYGFIFADLIEHDFVITRNRGNVVLEKGTQETRTRSIVDVQAQGIESSDGVEKETVTKRELYSTWFLAADSSPLPSVIRNSPRRLRNVSPFLPCLRALWAYQERHMNEKVPVPSIGHPVALSEFVTLVSEKQKALGTPEVPADKINSFLQGIMMREISPVVSVLGGELAQDVINTLGHTQQPIQNLAVFDGYSMQSAIYALHPDGNLGRALLKTAPQVSTAEAAAEASADLLGTVPQPNAPIAAGMSVDTGPDASMAAEVVPESESAQPQ